MLRLRRFWLAIALLLLPLIPLWRAVFLGETIGAFDQIRQMAPWNGPKPSLPWDVLQADSVLQFYPWRDLVLSSWGRFQGPYWNPYQLAGTPLLANSQSAGFYPPHILLGLLHVPTSTAITLLAWFHLFMAGLGVFWLVRKLGGTDIGAFVGGASFALSAFLLGWLPLASVVTTVCWIPWCLTAVVWLFDGGRSRATLLLALSTAMMILGGHLQFVAYGLMAVGLASLTLLATQRTARPFLATLLGLGVGLLITAPQLLPVLEYSRFSHRRNTPTEAGYTAYIASAVSPQDFLSRLVNPFSQGNPLEIADPKLPFSTFWPALAKPGANWAESASTVGPVVLLLLCLLPLAGVRWRKAGAVAMVGLVAVLLGVGTPLNRLLYDYVPGWSSTGSPSRILCLFVLVACALAGLALDERLLRLPKRSIYLAMAAFGVLMALSLMPTTAPAPKGMDPQGWAGLVASGNLTGLPTTLLATIVALAATAAYVFGKDSNQRLAVVAGPVAFGFLAYASVVRTGDPSFLKPATTPSFERIAVANQPWSLVAAAPATLPPNTATAMRQHDLAGYDSLLHRDTVDLLREIDHQDPAAEANGNLLFIKPNADRSLLAEAGVTEFWTRNGKEAIAGPGRVSVRGGSARIVEEGTDRIAIEAIGPGRLVLRDRNLPDWTASIDGKPASLMGTNWREIDLPGGRHEVKMRYTPPGMRLGLFCLIPGLFGMGILAALARRPQAKTVEEAEDEPDEELLAEAA